MEQSRAFPAVKSASATKIDIMVLWPIVVDDICDFYLRDYQRKLNTCEFEVCAFCSTYQVSLSRHVCVLKPAYVKYTSKHGSICSLRCKYMNISKYIRR